VGKKNPAVRGWAKVRNRPRGGRSALCHGALYISRSDASRSVLLPAVRSGERRRSTEAAYSVKAAKTKAPINAATAIAIRARKNLVTPSNAATTILFNGMLRKNAPATEAGSGGEGDYSGPLTPTGTAPPRGPLGKMLYRR
jgi:hypothetical protein